MSYLLIIQKSFSKNQITNNVRYFLRSNIHSNNEKRCHQQPHHKAFFDYTKFSSEQTKHEPPKRPDNFAKTYKRVPLYWMVKGTDVLKEHHRLSLAVAVYCLVTMAGIVAYFHYRVSIDPDLLDRKLATKYTPRPTPEREEILDLHDRLRALDLMRNFMANKLDQSLEIERLEPQVSLNYDDILHEGQIGGIGRDLTKSKTLSDKMKSLKDVDAQLRDHK